MQHNYNYSLFIETLKHAHGQYTDDTVWRAGKIVGSLAKSLDEVFHLNIAESELDGTNRKRHNYQEDIEAFVQEYWDDALFDIIPGRHHNTYKGFRNKIEIKNHEQFKCRLMKYSNKLDKSRAALL